MLVDSHCHLSSDEIYNDLQDVIERAHQVGVFCFLNAAGKFDELEKQLEICEKFKNVWTVTGVHPHDAMAYKNVTAEDVLKNTKYDKVIGIGECGLDYFYDFAPKDVQIKVFREMIKAAQESALPIVVHTRDAEADTMDILETAYHKKAFKGEIHCYSSSFELAKCALDIGFYVSASGMITFKNADNLRENFKKVPLERLLVETDTPYLAPIPMRGKTNEPANVRYTAQILADLKGISFEEISQTTTQNFFKLYDKAVKDE